MLLNILLAATTIYGGVTKEPKVIKEFYLSAQEVIRHTEERGRVTVNFWIDKAGEVGKIQVVDTFDIKLNPTIEDAVRSMKFHPAIQNGVPVPIRYMLPIVIE